MRWRGCCSVARGFCCDEVRMLLWSEGENAVAMRRRGCCCYEEERMLLWWGEEDAVVMRTRCSCCDEEERMLLWCGIEDAVGRRKVRMLLWWGWEDAVVMRRRDNPWRQRGNMNYHTIFIFISYLFSLFTGVNQLRKYILRKYCKVQNTA